MPVQIPINDFDDFCRVVVASGLSDADSIGAILMDFHAHAVRDVQHGASITSFANYLVAKGLLSYWQCAKLRNGQYKGFFLDDYKIIDHLGDDPTCNRFLAEDCRTSQCVVLCIRPPSIAPFKNGKPEYWVEEFNP